MSSNLYVGKPEDVQLSKGVAGWCRLGVAVVGASGRHRELIPLVEVEGNVSVGNLALLRMSWQHLVHVVEHSRRGGWEGSAMLR